MAFSFPVRFMSTEWHWNKGRQSGHHICIARNLGRWSRMEGKHPTFAGVCACHRRIPHNCYMVIQVLFIKFHTELCSLKILMTKHLKLLIFCHSFIWNMSLSNTSQSIKHCRNSNALPYRGAEWTEKCPRTIIYCTSIKDVSEMYSYVTKELPFTSTLLEMFHSETPLTKK